jgi:tRNA(fMet)-specific endonuclease VapC
MMVLDTDHISVLQHSESPAAIALTQRLDALTVDVSTTAVTLEEQSRSWLGLIGRYSDVRQQVAYYRRLVGMFDFFSGWQVLPFDERAAEEFLRLRSSRVRVATTDLKIAAVALTHGATLLSRNLQDFSQVPGLNVENWLEA